jgi:hypothetical protein
MYRGTASSAAFVAPFILVDREITQTLEVAGHYIVPGITSRPRRQQIVFKLLYDKPMKGSKFIIVLCAILLQ